MRKQRFCKDLVFGEAFENEPFVLQFIGNTSNGWTQVILSDRTGSVPCNIPENLFKIMAPHLHAGDVVTVSAAITAEKRQPLLLASTLQLCTDNFLPSELFSGISQEKKEEYIQLIKEALSKITNHSFLALLNACLTDENLRILGELPATHNDYGVYIGGALAATCSVTYMVMSSMAAYVHKGNGITTTAPGWNVLLTAALLHSFGRIDYCKQDDPFKKTVRGVRMNYFCTLQHSIENVIFKNNVPISEDDLTCLLNVLAVAVSKKTEVRAISKDGAILRHVIALYGECDAIDCQMANYEPEEGEEYFYSRKLRRYLTTEEVN